LRCGARGTLVGRQIPPDVLHIPADRLGDVRQALGAKHIQVRQGQGQQAFHGKHRRDRSSGDQANFFDVGTLEVLFLDLLRVDILPGAEDDDLFGAPVMTM